ncbi:hypothetical protein GCM10027423_39630 [Spirosoma arcticum]
MFGIVAYGYDVKLRANVDASHLLVNDRHFAIVLGLLVHGRNGLAVTQKGLSVGYVSQTIIMMYGVAGCPALPVGFSRHGLIK